MTELTIETKAYNSRRYGKPWIAKVDFSKSAKGDYDFGDWTGDQYNGGEGVLSIEASAGDIIATGQKDNRQPRKSAPDFYVVSANGDLDAIGDKGAAYKFFLARKTLQPLPPDFIAALLKEREMLIARIAEIDRLVGKEGTPGA